MNESPLTRLPEPLDDEIDLHRHVRSLWRARWLILATAALCGAVVFALSSRPLPPPSYEAITRLVVTGPKLPLGRVAPLALGADSFKILLHDASFAERVAAEFSRDRRSEVTASLIATHIEVESYERLVVVRARSSDPHEAVQIANRWAELGVELSRRLVQGEAERAEESGRTYLEESRKRLDDSQARLDSQGGVDRKRGSSPARLQVEVDAAKDAYRQASTRLEEMRFNVLAQNSYLQLEAPAANAYLVPAPAPTGAARRALAAAAAGFLLASAIALVLPLLARSHRPQPQA